MDVRSTSDHEKTVLSVRIFLVGQAPRPNAAEPQLGVKLYVSR